MTTLKLSARKPFNFHSVVNSHGWRQLAPCRFENDVLIYLDHLSTKRTVKYRISASPEGVQVETDKLNKAEQKEAAEKVAWMLGLEMDFSDFYAASRLEPKLARAKKQALGRLLRSPTLFEDVVKTILTTNTLWAATRNMSLKLVEEFGAPLPSAGRVAPNRSAGRTLGPDAHSLAPPVICPKGTNQAGVPRAQVRFAKQIGSAGVATSIIEGRLPGA